MASCRMPHQPLNELNMVREWNTARNTASVPFPSLFMEINVHSIPKVVGLLQVIGDLPR